METPEEFASEMKVRDITNNLIDSIEELYSKQSKINAIVYAFKMLNEQLNEINKDES
jgi:hypothetical protein